MPFTIFSLIGHDDQPFWTLNQAIFGATAVQKIAVSSKYDNPDPSSLLHRGQLLAVDFQWEKPCRWRMQLTAYKDSTVALWWMAPRFISTTLDPSKVTKARSRVEERKMRANHNLRVLAFLQSFLFDRTQANQNSRLWSRTDRNWPFPIMNNRMILL